MIMDFIRELVAQPLVELCQRQQTRIRELERDNAALERENAELAAKIECCQCHEPIGTPHKMSCTYGPHGGHPVTVSRGRPMRDYHGEGCPCPACPASLQDLLLMPYDQAGCAAPGAGGYHSDEYAEGEPCRWCGERAQSRGRSV
jgi:hypothetical protein